MAVRSDVVIYMATRNTSAPRLTSRRDDHYFSDGHRLNRGASEVGLTSELFGVACLLSLTNLISLPCWDLGLSPIKSLECVVEILLSFCCELGPHVF